MTSRDPEMSSKPNISKTAAGDAIYQQSLINTGSLLTVLQGSGPTVGYPSESLASC